MAQSTPTCTDLAEHLAFNASSTRNMAGLQMVYLGSESDREIAIQEDSSTTGTVSSHIQPASLDNTNPNGTQATIWLDTGDSDRERLGSRLGMCQNYMPV
jgi:hypothetical protein